MAVKYDDRTAKGWPLPHRENRLYDDVERLREALNLIDGVITGIEAHEGTIEGRQDSLSTRLDTILEGATEDSEILDARVDGDDTVHPNLGHNIRNLHRLIIELNESLKYEDSEFDGLLRQFGAVSEAQIQYELDEQEAHKRRKREIQQEALTRAEQDNGLQRQIGRVADGVIRLAFLIQDLSQKRRDDLTLNEDRLHIEINALDSDLHTEINALAESCLEDMLNLHDAIERRKADIKQEIEARTAKDSELQEQISGNARRIQKEEENRAEADRQTGEKINAEEQSRIADDENLHRQIEAEIHSRAEGDSGLARQAETNAQANIRNALNIQDVNERRKADLTREEQLRIAGDEGLQVQIDGTAEAEITNTLNLDKEAEKRRKLREVLDAEITERTEYDAQQDEEISRNAKDIEAEIHSRAEGDSGLARQAETNAQANIRNALNIQDVNERRKADLAHEEQARITADENLQEQINRTAEAGISNAINFHQEAQQRRKSDKRIDALKFETERLNDIDSSHQKQIDAALSAILRNALTLSEALSRIRSALLREELSRFEEDSRILAQTNINAEASMFNSLNIQEEAEKRRLLLARLIKESQDRERQIQDLRAEIGTLYEIPLPGLEEDISSLQTQANSNAITGIELALALSDEAEKRRNLERNNENRDRSNEKSLAISEPRCAVVNISGINSMPTSKYTELDAVMQFWDMQGNYFRKKITCAAQGNSSLGYIKKNMKFDLLNDDGSEFELKIGDWVSQDGFHLKAFYTDFFRGVGEVSYKFYDEILRFNGTDKDRPYKKALGVTEGVTPTGSVIQDTELQLETGALCHPDAFPCLVYLNGNFYGIFAWQLKKHRKNYHMDKSTVEHVHLDGTLSTDYFWDGVINWAAFEIRNPNKLYTMDGAKYDGDSPKELIDETSENYNPDNKDHKRTAKVKGYILGLVQSFGELKTLYATYTENPTAENLAAVKAKYEGIFDVENQRDYLIFGDIIKNSDGFRKNWQWTTYDGVKWWVNAYDLDMSFGGDWQGRYITAPLTAHITASTAIPAGYIPRLYNTELEARYAELREAGIIDTEHILAFLRDWVSRIGAANYEREYEKWPNSPCILNYTDSIYRVREWLDTEIANMDGIYHYSHVDTATQSALTLEALTRENADETESMIRAEQDDSLQTQMNHLAIANMWLAVREHDTHQKVKEIEIEAESIPERAATDDEFDEMLEELYNNP